MTEEQNQLGNQTKISEAEFESELIYRINLSVAKSMQKKGLITEEEYHQIDQRLLEVYYPILGRLLAGKEFMLCEKSKGYHQTFLLSQNEKK